VLTYEVAVQLTELGQLVEFAGLGDSSTPTNWFGDNLECSSGSPLMTLLDLYDNENLSAQDSTAVKELKIASVDMDFEELLHDPSMKSQLPPMLRDYNAIELQQLAARVMAHTHAHKKYLPKPISIPVHIFAAKDTGCQDEPPTRADLLLGWDSVMPEQQIQLIPVPGSHYTMMSDPDNIEALGRAISDAIAQASGAVSIGSGNVNGRLASRHA
jgi:thioesterase domain-containing protein